MDDTLDFIFTPDQRINFSVHRHLVEIERETLQRTTGLFCICAFGFGLIFLAGSGRRFGNAVRNEIHYVQTRYALLMQEIHGVRVFFAVNGHQYIGAGHFFFSGRLHMQDRALDDALETERRLRVHFTITGDNWRVLLDKFGERFFQFVDLGRARLQHFLCGRVFEQCEQQVFDGDELVPLLPCFDKCHVQTNFEFLRDHFVPFKDTVNQFSCNLLSQRTTPPT